MKEARSEDMLIKNTCCSLWIKAITMNITFASGSEGLKELDAQVKSMIEKSTNMIQVGNKRKRAESCKEKEDVSQAIKDHIEANHLEGVVLPCNQCEKTFRCRNTLRWHVRKYHQN